jgi:protein-disulfide isomerase
MTTSLSVPPGPGDHVRGDPSAKVTLVEYGDFECPYTRKAYPLVKELLAQSGRALRFIYRHLPLTQIHANAQMAAESSEGAAAQGKFWETHDLLFEHQNQLSPSLVLTIAQTLGLDEELLKTQVQERTFEKHVDDDVRSAQDSGVQGTPAFFLNGRRVQGVPTLETILQLARG